MVGKNNKTEIFFQKKILESFGKKNSHKFLPSEPVFEHYFDHYKIFTLKISHFYCFSPIISKQEKHHEKQKIEVFTAVGGRARAQAAGSPGGGVMGEG